MKRPTSGLSVPLPDEEWERVWPQLRLYVHSKYQRFHYKTGFELDEIASTALVDTMEGRQRYPPIDEETGLEKTDVSLFAFLCGVADKLVKAHRSTVYRLSELDEAMEIHEVHGLRRPFLPKQTAPDENARYNEIVKVMRELFKDDSTVDQIIQLWAMQPDLKPGEVAATLGISNDSMRNALKRLRRRLKKLRRFLR